MNEEEKTNPNQITAGSFEITLDQNGIQAKLIRQVEGPSQRHLYVQLASGTPIDKVLKKTKDLGFYLKLPNLIITPEPEIALLRFSYARDDRTFPNLELLGWDPAGKALPFIAGIDMMGNVVVEDLAKCPHLLLAGTTGSGKSVYMHNILCGMLRHRNRDQMKLLIVDPKGGAEFGIYRGIPHLYKEDGVMYDKFHLADTLQEIFKESERRFDKFARKNVQDIGEYNAKVEEPWRLPYIVIVIDELADLMQQHKRTMAPLIQSLVQKCRASGVHMILGMQRPSVQILPGDLKANCPTRVALRTQTKVDSRVILDENGAEDLLGAGDLLYSRGGVVTRLQSPFVSNEYRTKFLKQVREEFK